MRQIRWKKDGGTALSATLEVPPFKIWMSVWSYGGYYSTDRWQAQVDIDGEIVFCTNDLLSESIAKRTAIEQMMKRI